MILYSICQCNRRQPNPSGGRYSTSEPTSTGRFGIPGRLMPALRSRTVKGDASTPTATFSMASGKMADQKRAVFPSTTTEGGLRGASKVACSKENALKAKTGYRSIKELLRKVAEIKSKTASQLPKNIQCNCAKTCLTCGCLRCGDFPSIRKAKRIQSRLRRNTCTHT